MERTYFVCYWNENEFGDMENYSSIFGGKTVEEAKEIADSYRECGWHVKVETTYSC